MLQGDLVSDACCCCGVTVMVSQCLEQAFAVEELFVVCRFTVVGLTEWYMRLIFSYGIRLETSCILGWRIIGGVALVRKLLEHWYEKKSSAKGLIEVFSQAINNWGCICHILCITQLGIMVTEHICLSSSDDEDDSHDPRKNMGLQALLTVSKVMTITPCRVTL